MRVFGLGLVFDADGLSLLILLLRLGFAEARVLDEKRHVHHVPKVIETVDRGI